MSPELESLLAQSRQVRNRSAIYQAGYRDTQTAIQQGQGELESLSRLDGDLTEALSVLSGLVDSEVKAGFVLIETLLQESMKNVFPDLGIQVGVEVGQERGRVSADIITSAPCQGGRVEGLASDLFGGSISTVQSIFLRMACILRRGLRRFLILDETLAPLDEGYAKAFVEVFSNLCRELQFDVLCITHSVSIWENSPKRYKVQRGPHGSKLLLDKNP